jgi:hypothetical protein
MVRARQIAEPPRMATRRLTHFTLWSLHQRFVGQMTSSPSFSPLVTASVRLAAPSFARMELT